MRTVKMKCYKTLLICPPYIVSQVVPKRVQSPLGVAYLGACLEREGYEVKILDAVIEGWGEKQCADGRLLQWGLTAEKILNVVDNYHPDIVGISCLFTVQSPFVIKLCRLIKESHPNIITVLGGAHPTAVPEKVMADQSVDFIILGEGEKSFMQLVKCLGSGEDSSNIDGIAYRRDGRIVINHKKAFIENLDDLPFPAWHLLPMDEYCAVNRPHGVWSTAKRRASMITSRGCPAQCIFCSIHGIWGSRYRKRGIENIIDEMRYLKEHFGIEEICIEDDNLTLDKERARKLFDRILEEKFGFSFIVPNGVAIWSLDEDLLERMRACGFQRLTLAVESGNQDVLENVIHKPLKLSHVKKIIGAAKKLGFSIDTFYVIGFPEETLDQMHDTFRFSRKLDVDSAKYFIATPYPGTPLFELCKKKHYLPEETQIDWQMDFTEPYYETEFFSKVQLKKLLLRETFKTQLLALFRHPIRTSCDVLRYVTQNPSESLAFLASCALGR